MTREECENQILGKLKEIKDIVKQYDKSKELYSAITINDAYMSINNAYWKTETPLDAIRYDNGRVVHFEH